MKNLFMKELSLCLHPTAFIFLSFCVLALVPNYPYEVIFFFSGLSVFFTCLTSRENGDLAFTCALPVKKRQVPLARIIIVACLQGVLMLLTLAVCVIKQAIFPVELIENAAGISANLTLIAHGAVLLGIFNIIFFPMHYRNPEKVGVPFVISAVAVFFVIMVLIVLRYACPLWADTLNGLNSYNTGAKLCALAVGLCIYAALTALACRISCNQFEKIDL